MGELSIKEVKKDFKVLTNRVNPVKIEPTEEANYLNVGFELHQMDELNGVQVTEKIDSIKVCIVDF